MLTLCRTHLGDFAATLGQLWWCRNSWATWLWSHWLLGDFGNFANLWVVWQLSLGDFVSHWCTFSWRRTIFDVVQWRSSFGFELLLYNITRLTFVAQFLTGVTWRNLQWVSEYCFSYKFKFNRLADVTWYSVGLTTAFHTMYRFQLVGVTWHNFAVVIWILLFIQYQFSFNGLTPLDTDSTAVRVCRNFTLVFNTLWTVLCSTIYERPL